MKRMQGFTLVEVIISIALIGIIAIAFLSAMAGHYSLTVRTRGITKDTVNAQQRIEQDIDAVKKSVESGVTPSGQTLVTLFSGTAYERTVTAYIREQSIPGGAPAGSRKLYTVVADERPNIFATASITGNTASLKKGADLYPVAHYNLPALSAQSVTTRSDPSNVHLMYLHRWYVSRIGFHIMSKGIPLEVEPGTVFPRFPDDYVLIPGATDENLINITSAYAGRHLVHTALSASTSGKMGVAVPSNPVFVSGLPVTTNLRVHLDASLVDVTDNTIVRTSGSNRYLRTWTDIDGYGGPQFNNAMQTSNASQPQLLRQMMGYVTGSDGLECESHAQYAAFSGSNLMSIPNHSTVNMSQFTAFVAFRSDAGDPDKSLIAKIGYTSDLDASWRIGWVGEDTLGLFVRDGSGTEDRLAATPFEGLDDNWHILRATVGSGVLELQIDDGMVYHMPRTTNNNISRNHNDSVLDIGGDRAAGNVETDIGEVLLYHSAMDAADVTAVRTYLQNKYRPVPPAVFIYSMQNVVRTVDMGDTTVLPDTLPANMTNGTVREVAVTWVGHTAGDAVDTSLPGTRTFQAITVAEPHLLATYTVQVLGISSMEPMELVVDVNTPVVLPDIGVANMSNGSTRNTAVEWPDGAAASVDNSVIGATAITGWAQLDPTKPVQLTVRVVPTRVTGVEMSPAEVVVHQGATTTLTANVLPAGAANPAVTYRSEDTTIATVNAAGVVRGIAPGSTVITVKTVDGGYEAQSTVHVVVPANGISLSPSSANLVLGAQTTLTATVQPLEATLREVTWSSSNTAVATVSNSGVVTAVGGGTASITARTVDGGFTASCTVQVTVPVTGVTLNVTTYNAEVGDRNRLTATITPSNATNKAVVWSSDDTRVATVDGNGNVEAVRAGNVTITVRTADGGHTATCRIQVSSGSGCD